MKFLRVSAHYPTLRNTARLLAIIVGTCVLAIGANAQLPVLGSGGVTSGSATITQSGNVTNVNQTTQKAAINWQSFSIGSKDTVDFNQPNSSSITLNRVIGNDPSVLAGTLNATGRVFLINSNGMIFTRGSNVNTGGFLASTLDISNADFMAGNYVFNANGSTGSIVNQGFLTSHDGGYVVLLGNKVSNQGFISATKGTVGLASGDQISLRFSGDSLLNVTVNKGTLNALVENKQAIYADGGTVILTAKAADNLLSAQVNNSGIIQAHSIDDLMGTIRLSADGGTTTVTGTLDASAPNGGNGGTIETSGNKVEVGNESVITTSAANGKTGNWLIDPDGFTIASSGGDITGAKLSSLLGNNNVTLSSTQGSGNNGDLNVNDSVNWSANTGLTLSATNNVNINKSVTSSGDNAAITLNAGKDININDAVTETGTNAAFTMNYGGYATTGSAATGTDYHINNITTNSDDSFTIGPASITLSGSNASLTINGSTYTLIHSMDQLAAISPVVLDTNGNPIVDPNTGYYQTTPAFGNFAIAQNLDASGKTYPYWVVSTLYGNLAGLGHSINNLTISSTNLNQFNIAEDASLVDNLGVFGADPSAAQIRDLGLTNVNILGASTSAGIVSYSYGTLSNVYVTGNLTGIFVGGVADSNLGGNVSNAHSNVNISALNYGTDVGGLVGENWSGGTGGVIDHSTATGTINVSGVTASDGSGLTPATDIGGLVGLNYGTVQNSSANVAITANNSLTVGGLVGENYDGSISNSSSSGSMTLKWTNGLFWGTSYGGLVGDNTGGTIDGSNSSVAITATAAASNGLPITEIGGLVGSNQPDLIFGTGGTITNSSSSGSVTVFGPTWEVGGSVGVNYGTITNVQATGDVTTSTYGFAGGTVTSLQVGGLVGLNSGTISGSSYNGTVTGGSDVGGLVGQNTGTITGSTATANVTGIENVGAIAGSNSGGTITGNNATVSGTNNLIGNDDGTGSVSNNSYSNLNTIAQTGAMQAAPTNQPTQGSMEIADSALDLLDPSRLFDMPQILDNSIIFGDLSNYSAHIKSVIVNGEQYDVDQKKPKDPEKKDKQ